jgi:integrase
MLRHACGYKLANDGHDTRALQHYLGHRNIQHTTRFTEMAADRFREPSGDGRWYWEVISAKDVIARGVADTEPEACKAASDAAREANLIE